MDALPCVALLLRLGTREIVAMNKAARDAGARLGATCFGSWPKLSAACSFCRAPVTWATGKPQILEVEALGTIWEAHWVPITGDLYLHYAFDVTERRKTQAAITNLQKLESLGSLAGGIAHDFNNILTGIIGNLSLLKADLGQSDEKRELAQEAEAACQTARGLARQLLTFATGGAPIVEIVELEPIVRNAVGFAARGAQVRSSCIIDGAPIFVRADKDQISQVLQNLVINSVQAMPMGGNITVQVSLAQLGPDEIPGWPREGMRA